MNTFSRCSTALSLSSTCSLSIDQVSFKYFSYLIVLKSNFYFSRLAVSLSVAELTFRQEDFNMGVLPVTIRHSLHRSSGELRKERRLGLFERPAEFRERK